MTPNPFRQVHLDFHTSPHIPDIAADFDPAEFVRTLQAAHVNSITVFAKCHHGYSYYPTKVGTPHPHLTKSDLLGEMITACHQAGIRIPIYTTAVWDELAWANHPEWRVLLPDGHITGPSNSPLEPGWKDLCLNTGYADYLIAQIEEILQIYPDGVHPDGMGGGDGLFVDIVRYFKGACVCSTCLKQINAQGLDPKDPRQMKQFTLENERCFMQRVAQAVRAIKPGQSLFFNSRLKMDVDANLGNRPEMDNFTHIEIESLPGGGWGYDHFPMYVRYYQTFDRPLVAMNGRFHTSWGDFGGLRNREALEFECFQALAHGATCSIGDQLHPRGRLDPAVYQRIGEVYEQIEKREAWCRDTQTLPEIGVFTASASSTDSHPIHPSDVGALHILEQLKYQFQFIDTAGDLSAYKLVILPDSVPVDAALAVKLRDYLAAGGRLLVSGTSSLNETSNDFQLAAEMGVHYAGPAAYAPDYLLVETELADGIEPMAHVCALQGSRVTPVQYSQGETGLKVLARSGAPYFNRTWEHFCSHQYTPYDAPTQEPVITQHNQVIYIARPLFREYAESARRVHKTVIGNCIRRLLPDARIGANNLPSSAIVTVRRQQASDSLIVHILNYVHQRRGQQGVDVIEDILPLYQVGIALRAAQQPTEVRTVPEGSPLKWDWQDSYIHIQVPCVKGYQMLQISGVGG